MKKILVSGCLFGWHVRYDDGDTPCQDPRFLTWVEEGRLIPVCPEVFGGLSTPRPDAQRVSDQLITCTGENVTKEYEIGVYEALRLAKEHEVVCCIMKQDSPSCGSKFIYDGSFTDTKVPGEGWTVEVLRKADFKVFDEDEIDEVAKYLEMSE